MSLRIPLPVVAIFATTQSFGQVSPSQLPDVSEGRIQYSSEITFRGEAPVRSEMELGWDLDEIAYRPVTSPPSPLIYEKLPLQIQIKGNQAVFLHVPASGRVWAPNVDVTPGANLAFSCFAPNGFDKRVSAGTLSPALSRSLNRQGEVEGITLSFRNKPERGFWVYSGRLPVGQGKAIPALSMLSWQSGRQTSRIRFHSATFGRGVAQPLMPNWYRPGITISDQRVSPPVGWSFNELVVASSKSSGLTPQELLKLSQARAKGLRPASEHSEARAATRRASAPQNQRQSWQGPAMIFAVVLAGGLIGYALSRRRAR